MDQATLQVEEDSYRSGLRRDLIHWIGYSKSMWDTLVSLLTISNVSHLVTLRATQ